MEKEKQLNNWTRKELEALPVRKWSEDIGEFDSLIILPQHYLHDSGYRCMDFVAVREQVPFCRLSGCSDVIHFDGIGGFGYKWFEVSSIPRYTTPVGWQIDCLKNGLLRIMSGRKMKAGDPLSSFELFAIR